MQVSTIPNSQSDVRNFKPQGVGLHASEYDSNSEASSPISLRCLGISCRASVMWYLQRIVYIGRLTIFSRRVCVLTMIVCCVLDSFQFRFAEDDRVLRNFQELMDLIFEEYEWVCNLTDWNLTFLLQVEL